jgi:hypothetical protein
MMDVKPSCDGDKKELGLEGYFTMVQANKHVQPVKNERKFLNISLLETPLRGTMRS